MRPRDARWKQEGLEVGAGDEKIRKPIPAHSEGCYKSTWTATELKPQM